MWYFTWILGLGFAIGAGILNALWLETQPRSADLTDDDLD